MSDRGNQKPHPFGLGNLAAWKDAGIPVHEVEPDRAALTGPSMDLGQVAIENIHALARLLNNEVRRARELGVGVEIHPGAGAGVQVLTGEPGVRR